MSTFTSTTEDPQPKTAVPAVSWRRIWVLALPVLAEYLLNLAVGWSENVLTGSLLGEERYLAALTIGSYVHWLVDGAIALVSVGAHVLVAQRLGAGLIRQANQALAQALVLAAGCGLVIALAIWLLTPALAEVLGVSPEAQTEAIHYLRIVSLSYPFLFIMQVSCYALHAAGKTLPALGVVGLASVIGGLSSWALAAGCGSLASLGCGPGDDLGFEGIALGGALGFALAGVFALRLLIHGCGPLRLERAWPRLNWLTAKQIFALGAPTAAGSVAVLGCSFWHLGLVARLGDGALAAHGVAVHCEWLSRLVGDAFAVAAASFVGQYLGAGRPDLAYRAAWRALLSGGSCMMAMGALFYLAAPTLFGFFVDPERTPAFREGTLVLQLIAFAQPALAVAVILAWSLQAGAGDRLWPMLVTIGSPLFVAIPMTYILSGPAHLGLMGAWIALLLDAYVRAGALLWRFLSGRWLHALMKGVVV